LYLHSNREHVHVEPSYLNQNHSCFAYFLSYVTLLWCFWLSKMLTKSSSTVSYRRPSYGQVEPLCHLRLMMENTVVYVSAKTLRCF
jgi:hypothetical protein